MKRFLKKFIAATGLFKGMTAADINGIATGLFKSVTPTGLCILTVVMLMTGCNQKRAEGIILSDAEILHQNVDLATQVIIYDVFSPPVASRIYAYSSLAAYEAIRFSEDGNESIAEKLHGWHTMPNPEPDKEYNYTLAATAAFFKVLKNIKVFSVDSLKQYEEQLDRQFKQTTDTATYQRSVLFGTEVADAILARALTDGYTESRAAAKFLGSDEDGKWRPTSPDYLDGTESSWKTIKPLVLDSCSQFLAPGPPPYSKDTNSAFYRSVKEVYTVNKSLTEEQKTIARYWDDNPFVMEHAGHLMFATKKITPGGHWMGIAAIASRQTNASPVMTAKTYALTAIALFDGFIACWDEKYRSNYIRPITIINDMLDKNFTSFLQTPSFPEYTSGHSVITASASKVLTSIYGDNFSFRDTTNRRYIGLERSYRSFREAADEAAISRLYGGIHFMESIRDGSEQGRKVAQLVIDRLLNDSDAQNPDTVQTPVDAD